MTPQQRRNAIRTLLEEADSPVSATALAGRMMVSRQVIVGDIALLRAAGTPVAATPRGYVLSGPAGVPFQIQVVCRHTAGQMAGELNTLVDLGCTVEDVSVDHPVYGQLTGQLRLSCRGDVAFFLEKTRSSAAKPLSALTQGLHTHTLRAEDSATLENARDALRAMNILQE